MLRREFLSRALRLGGAALLGGRALASGTGIAAAAGRAGKPASSRFVAMTEHSAKESPVDTVVVVMMENRSFDHFFGWLADDHRYLERGRKRYGKKFHVDGKQHQTFLGADGTAVETVSWVTLPGEANPYRGCGHPDPGHAWEAGRAQRDHGFLSPGSGNDRYALGFYGPDALPFTAKLAREFSVCDRWHASLLGPTFPNREYLHSAQSGGTKTNALPFGNGQSGFTWETIWDRIAKANVPAAYYATDLPTLALWGSRLSPYIKKIDQYFSDAAGGTLPQVVFVDPAFLSGSRTDDHPHADIRAGQRFLRDVFKAFAQSKHWKRGAFILTYDEWGGFFDHVAPPRLPDDRTSTVDAENFGQAGFRVPALVASPFARRGYLDHRLYDHTSILRFLEWRFLGAPAHGPGKDGDTWFLTARDRNAANLGDALSVRPIRTEIGFDVDVPVGDPSPPCGGEGGGGLAFPARELEMHAFEAAMRAGYFDAVGVRVDPSPMAREWARG